MLIYKKVGAANIPLARINMFQLGTWRYVFYPKKWKKNLKNIIARLKTGQKQKKKFVKGYFKGLRLIT